MTSIDIGSILSSNNSRFFPSDAIYMELPFPQYASLAPQELQGAIKIDNYFTGPLGGIGLTAFSPLYKIGQPKKGDIIFVSSAAGAVDSVVGQLAKREGLMEKPMEALAQLAQKGFDTYYENAGGSHLEAALRHIRARGGNAFEIFFKRLALTGFIVTDEDFGPAYFQQHQETLQKWIAECSFKVKLHIIHGIDNAPESFKELYQSKNFGKALVKIKG
ncbi:hypothetical protein F4813DRAFT_394167 [Daldinia decipiens]|uniref:uncharacterized protein n=1 Tax=Daldinia decipiens TaxID=326647 RepID=UPI0020C3F6AA|nr:uncharacterized protein F4813DRAFT_394167 [Daldinia decipiens]KAI1652916.1 hypothetical protein F4813DRAFT_394167 [Daldinia decipiens]